MSMSTCVELLRDGSDELHQKKAKVLKACLEAGVSIPEEIIEYFDGCYDPDGPLKITFEARRFHTDSKSGYEIDLSELPEGVKTIRFYNSY